VGGFIAAAHHYIPHVVDATMTEVFALRDGLLLAQQIGCNRVEIRADLDQFFFAKRHYSSFRCYLTNIVQSWSN
jgi:hypothetical protein